MELIKVQKDWAKKKIKDIAPLQRGFDLPKSKVERGKYPVVYSNGIENYHNEFIDRGPGIITGRSGTLGKVNYVADDYWPHNTTLWVTDFKGNYPRFLYYLYIFIELERFGSGSGVPTLNRNDVHDFEVLIPESPEEQQAIASALSDVDELIRSLDGLIQKKKAIKKGAMQQLLSGKKRLPGFDGEWEVKTLGELADIQRGASPRPISDLRWFSDNKEVGWVRISDISKSDGKHLHKTRDYLSEEGMKRSRYLDSGSLIMSIAATVGLPVITKMDLCIHDGFVGFWNLRDVDKEFLFYKLKFHEEEFINAGQTGSQNNINSDIVKNFESYFPSVEEQKAIAQILSDMDRELQTLRQKREKYVQIKQGMMHELLTGRVRLV